MDRWPADLAHIAQAVERLRQGAVIAIPTDTVYGVVARAADPDAVRRLYEVKHRPAGQQMIWLVKDASQVEPVATVSPEAASLMARFWPGPLTLVLRAKDQTPSPDASNARFAPSALLAWAGGPALPTRGRESRERERTIAFRAPDHPVALDLLAQLNEPVSSSSANRAGDPPPTDANQVEDRLGDTVDIILDGGPCRIGQPSTILDLSGPKPRILREGAIRAAQLCLRG